MRCGEPRDRLALARCSPLPPCPSGWNRSILHPMPPLALPSAQGAACQASPRRNCSPPTRVRVRAGGAIRALLRVLTRALSCSSGCVTCSRIGTHPPAHPTPPPAQAAALQLSPRRRSRAPHTPLCMCAPAGRHSLSRNSVLSGMICGLGAVLQVRNEARSASHPAPIAGGGMTAVPASPLRYSLVPASGPRRLADLDLPRDAVRQRCAVSERLTEHYCSPCHGEQYCSVRVISTTRSC